MNRPLQHTRHNACVALTVNATCKAESSEEGRLIWVAEETPIAFRYSGFPYAVMMATPDDLEDFAVGFSLTEGIAARDSDIPDISVVPCDDGITIDISLKGADLHRYLATRRVRQLRGHTSCGLCGVEDIDDVARPLTRVAPAEPLGSDVIRPALDALRLWQPLSRQTRGAHASAWVDRDGELLMVR